MTPYCPECGTLLPDPLIRPGDLVTCQNCRAEFIMPNVQGPPKKQRSRKKSSLGCGCLFILLVLGCSMIAVFVQNDEDTAPFGLTVSQQAQDELPIISGLEPVDVYLNFTNKGFTLESDFSDPKQKIWRCIEDTSQHTALIEAFGNTVNDVTLVRGTYLGTSSENINRTAGEPTACGA